MHVLLPPSETKRSGGDSFFSLDALSHHEVLGEARRGVIAALVELSSDEDQASRALKLGVKSRAERLHNLELETSGTMPAVDRYTGVLFDALEASSLSSSARRWAARHVSIQSALFGLIGADDRIPAYRLSASTRLPALGTTLKREWGEAHSNLDWSAAGWILDLRSKDYSALAPLPESAGATLRVLQRGADGELRALNHFNKTAKGDLVRRLANSRPRVSGEVALVRWAESEGLEMSQGPSKGELTLVTTLGAPPVPRVPASPAAPFADPRQ